MEENENENEMFAEGTIASLVSRKGFKFPWKCLLEF